jgi:Phosphotransferase enzyme family
VPDREILIVILVPHPTRLAVLTTLDRALPTVMSSASSTAELLDDVATRLGSLPPVLRIIMGPIDGDGESDLRLVDLETIGPDAPAGFTWTDPAALDLAAAAPPELRDAVDRAIGRHRDGPGPLDPPWSRPGWFARASTWMTDRMVEFGLAPTAPPRVIYVWGIAIVLRAESAVGAVFLKRSAPVFSQEAVVTGILAEATPDLVTRVAAVEPDEGWLLMHDHGDRVLGNRPQDEWAAGLDRLATIQRAWTTRTGELVRAGAPVRSLQALAEAVPSFASRDALASQLSPEDRAAWDAAVPALAAACRRLDELGPSPTLVHGDFHPWNVADEPAGPRVFDWTDAAISHPFTDLAVYATRPDEMPVRRAMRDAYLERWSDRLDPAALAEAGDLAIVVGTLYQVDSYLRIIESLEPDDLWDLAPAVGSFARAAVATLTDGIDLVRPGHADG